MTASSAATIASTEPAALNRLITKTYCDPVVLIWTHAASCMGMRIRRSTEVNASWDGVDTLTIGSDETLDQDDCLAQMVLHEACHALCEGEPSLRMPDWGLGDATRSMRVNEHACLRLQAAFADTVGMRGFFASTTMFRAYYDSLPADPLADDDDPAVSIARRGWELATKNHWADHLGDALRRTAAVADQLSSIAPIDSLWHGESR